MTRSRLIARPAIGHHPPLHSWEKTNVFGDGTVVMLNTPGHTPGHHSLMVRLKEKGAVILIGDLAHFHEN